MYKSRVGNKTQSKVILLAQSLILHGSLFSQKANSRISSGLRMAALKKNTCVFFAFLCEMIKVDCSSPATVVQFVLGGKM